MKFDAMMSNELLEQPEEEFHYIEPVERTQEEEQASRESTLEAYAEHLAAKVRHRWLTPPEKLQQWPAEQRLKLEFRRVEDQLLKPALAEIERILREF